MAGGGPVAEVRESGSVAGLRSAAEMLGAAETARLADFRRMAERTLPGRVVAVVLFGSRARGEARPDSDYDVAAFLDAVPDFEHVVETLTRGASIHFLADFAIHPLPLPASHLTAPEESRPAVVDEILRDGLRVP